jgi:hypothetical protein
MTALNVYRSWVAQVTGLQVVLEDEDDPTVPRPNVDDTVQTYALIGWDRDDVDASPIEVTTNTDAGAGLVEQHRTELRTGSLAVDIYGPGATDYVRALRFSITHAATLALLLAAGDYAIRKAGVVLPDPLMRSVTREPHASCVFEVAWTETVIVDVEHADTTEITTSIDEED